MDVPEQLTNAERRQKERKVWRTGLLVSLVLHAAVFLAWTADVELLSPYAAAGPRAGGSTAAAGSMQAMNLRAPETPTVTPPPIPVPDDVVVEPIEFDEAVEVDASDGIGEAPGLEAPGLADGTGAGDGGTAEEGRFRMVPPSPRGMIIPPANDELKGREVEVWVFVDERGRVVPDSTVLRPPTPDQSFNERLIREAAEWVFTPARKGAERVATWFPYRISM